MYKHCKNFFFNFVYFGVQKYSFLLFIVIFYYNGTLGAKDTINNKKQPLICLTQITSHPSLDKVRKGILDVLNDKDTPMVDVIYENAQGNIGLTVQIAQRFLSKNPNILVAIGTSSAQALKKAIAQKPIFLVFASISDPIQAGLVENLEYNQYTTGTINLPEFHKLLYYIQKTLPHLKSLGVVFNPAEKNANDLLILLKKEALEFNINIEESTANSTLEVYSATQKLVNKIDGLILLQDNTTAAALSSIIKVGQEHALPIFASYPEAVLQGALFAIAADEYEIGKQTGHIILQILAGKNSIPVEKPKQFKTYINFQKANSLHIVLPDDLIESALN